MENEKQQMAMVNVSRPQTFTDVDLDCTEFPQPTFTIPGLVPNGLTILAGKPKVGKSLLAYNLGLCLASGQKALGAIPLDPCEVLYMVLEETPGKIKSKLAKMRGTSPLTNRIHFAFSWNAVDKKGLEDLDEWLKDHPAVKLVVIDTFSRFRGWKASRLGYDRGYEAVALIKKVADEKGVAIVLIHHLRKTSAEDQMDQVMGTVGITGAADSILILSRQRLNSGSELFITGRDIEEMNIALQFDSDSLSWRFVGDAEEHRLSKERQEVIQLLKDAKGPLKLKDIASALGKKEPGVHKHLTSLLEAGLIEQPGYGLYQIRKTSESSETGKSGESFAVLQ